MTLNIDTEREPGTEASGASEGPVPLLHQDNGISIKSSPSGFTAAGAKRKLRLEIAIQMIVDKCGYNNTGFLTITFPENLQDWDIAQQRFNSFATNVLSAYASHWALVVQQQQRGAIHYHLVVGLEKDIRTGTNIKVIKDRSLPKWLRYGKDNVNANLREYWTDICARARGDKEFAGRENSGYGIGRIELMPLEKEPIAVARYLANYLKIDAYVPDAWKKKKKIRFSKTISCRLSSRFSANTFGHYLWRRKLEVVAAGFGMRSTDELADYFGERWFWVLREAISTLPLNLDKGMWKAGKAEWNFAETVMPYMEWRYGQKDLDDDRWKAHRQALGQVWEKLEESLTEQTEEYLAKKVEAFELKGERQMLLVLMKPRIVPTVPIRLPELDPF